MSQLQPLAGQGSAVLCMACIAYHMEQLQSSMWSWSDWTVMRKRMAWQWQPPSRTESGEWEALVRMELDMAAARG